MKCRIIALKNIFSKQLPNMPRAYIARLLMDRSHRSVVVVRKGTHVVGGITYRPFHSQVGVEVQNSLLSVRADMFST